MHRRIRALAVVAVSAVLALVAAGCSSSTGSTNSTGAAGGGASTTGSSKYPAIPAGNIVLCGSYPISGENAAFGSTAAETAKIDQTFINDLGGIAGHHVIVTVQNDQSSATVGVNIAEQYASEHAQNPNQCPVVYQLSQDPSTAPLQAAILSKAKIVILASQSPDQFFNPSQYPYFFSVSPPDKALGDAAAHFLIEKKMTKVAVLTDNIPQELEYISDLEASAKADGTPLDIVKTASIPPGATNAQAALSTLRSANPDVVLVATEYGFGPIWQSFHTLGWSPNIMGDVGFFYDGYNALGDLASKAYAPCWQGENVGQSLPSQVVGMINQIAPLNGGIAPDPIIAASVSMEQMLLAKYAIEKYDSLDPAALQAALQGMDKTELLNWEGMQFTESSSFHGGLVGPYGAGICQSSPLGKVGDKNFPVFIYADNYRSSI
jgi:ABC-type branched-subunit amino acid transport system substrate-binding protein